MRNTIRIFKRDLFRLMRNPLAVVVIIGVCILPSLYAWCNIAANIDPYANTKNIKIAVCSEDTGASLQGEKLNAGDEVIKKVKENEKLGWVFCDREEALEKVYGSEVYAAIIIPESFSSDLIAFSQGKIETPKIEYYVNQKMNAISPKITDTGASTVQEQINSTFSGIVASAVSETVEKAAGTASDDIESTNSSVLTYIKDIKDHIGNYQTALQSFIGIIDTSKADFKEARTTLDDANKAIEECAKVTSTVTSDLKEIRSTVQDISSEISSDIATESMKLEQAYVEINTVLTDVEEAARSAKSTITTTLDQMNKLVELDENLLARYKEQVEKIQIEALKQILLERIQATEEELSQTKAMIASMEANLETVEALIDSVQALRTEAHDKIKQGIDDLDKYQSTVFFPTIMEGLDNMSEIASEMTGVINGLKPSIKNLKTIVGQLEDSLDKAQDAFSKTSNLLEKAKTKLSAIETDLQAIKTSEMFKTLQELKKLNVEAIKNFMSSPVVIDTQVIYPVENYGSAMAPFFTNLAIWVGGLVLASILKAEVDKEGVEGCSVASMYFGRLLLFILLGAIQAIIACVGDYALIGAQCLHKGTFVLTGVFCSIAYTTCIYSMALTFKHIGKALCVLIVILQIPGSGGTYPIEMTPVFFQKIHPFLPFTYGVNAMRECIAGYYSTYLLNNWICLAILVAIALFIGLVIRPRILNLNYMFDRKLHETDLIAAETDSEEYKSVDQILMMDTIVTEETVRERAAAFEKTYKKRIKLGFAWMGILGIAFLVLMFSLESKIIFLTLWVISLVILSVYLLVIEYLHTKMARQLETLPHVDDEEEGLM